MFSAARRWPAIGVLFSFTSVIFVVQVRASKLSSSVYYHPQLFAYMFTRSPPCIDGRLHLWRLLQALLLFHMPLTTWLLFYLLMFYPLSTGCEYFRLPSCSIELPCFQFTSSLVLPQFLLIMQVLLPLAPRWLKTHYPSPLCEYVKW